MELKAVLTENNSREYFSVHKKNFSKIKIETLKCSKI